MAAGRSIGSVFLDYDVNFEPATKSQARLLKDATSVSLNIEDNFKKLGIKSSAEMDLMRAKITNSYDMIAASSKATTADILRAEQAKNAQLSSLNEQQFGKHTSFLDGLKSNYLAASAAIVAAWMAVNRAVGMMDEAGKALRAESAFKIMADEAGANSDRMIAAMQKAVKYTVDDSDLMQKAVKLMLAGYDPTQIERFAGVVGTSAMYMGTTTSEAFDALGDALANRTPKALVKAGAATREQMAIVTEAIAAGATQADLMALAIANLELKQLQLKGTQDEATIALQRFHTTVKELTETIGKGLIVVFSEAYRTLQYFAGGILGIASAYASYRAIVYAAIGDETKATENRSFANAAWQQRNDLLKEASKSLLVAEEIQEKATKTELAGAKAVVDAQMDKMRAIAGAKDAEKARAKVAEDEIKAWVKIVEDQLALDETLARYELENIEKVRKAREDAAKDRLKDIEAAVTAERTAAEKTRKVWTDSWEAQKKIRDTLFDLENMHLSPEDKITKGLGVVGNAFEGDIGEAMLLPAEQRVKALEAQYSKVAGWAKELMTLMKPEASSNAWPAFTLSWPETAADKYKKLYETVKATMDTIARAITDAYTEQKQAAYDSWQVATNALSAYTDELTRAGIGVDALTGKLIILQQTAASAAYGLMGGGGALVSQYQDAFVNSVNSGASAPAAPSYPLPSVSNTSTPGWSGFSIYETGGVVPAYGQSESKSGSTISAPVTIVVNGAQEDSGVLSRRIARDVADQLTALSRSGKMNRF